MAGGASVEQPSRVSGPTEQPLLDLTVGEALDRAVSEWGERDALIARHQDIRWTYSELGEAVDAVAGGLLALGLDPGDRIGIWSPNNAEWVVTQFASAKAGLILVNINPAYRLAELEYALNKVECKALVLADRFKSSDYVEMIRALAREVESCEPGALRAAKLPHLRTLVVIGDRPCAGFHTFAEISGLAPPDAREILDRRQRAMRPRDPINVQFTSGTTGFPKGATLTHHNILNSAFFTSEPLHLSAEDRLCIPVPLYHCFGMVISVLGCVTHGAAMVFPSAGFEPGAVLEAIAAERCTAIHGVPTMFIAQLEHPDFGSFDLSSLRTGIMAGAPCPIEVMRRVIDQMHMRDVTIAYGMTETSPTSFQSAVDDPIERRVSTVGRVHPHVEGKVVDEHGETVPRGHSGELCARGYNVMCGYWNDDDLTREAVDAEGWMHTGDLATIDAEGYCNIVGRVKDMIIRGGENVYPREIEEFLYRHPKIQEIAVFGVPDDRFGEQIAAWIRLKDGESSLTADEVRDFCKGQIAHFKIPAYVKFVSEFPMTVTGKVQKFVMRERMAEELGLVERASA